MSRDQLANALSSVRNLPMANLMRPKEARDRTPKVVVAVLCGLNVALL